MLTNLILMAVAMTTAHTTVAKSDFGKTQAGTAVALYTLKSEAVEVQIATYGARIVRLRAPDRHGKVDDVVLGYDNVRDYELDTKTYFGAIVGRYGNRIAGGKFTLDGVTSQVPLNNGKNALHGGPVGFDRKVWAAKIIDGGVELTLVSPAGEMGFPGKLTARVTYTLVGAALHVRYMTTSDAPTVVNLTNHAYFNLDGGAGSDILAHVLTLDASRFTPVDDGLIPTGELASVERTPFDFRKPTAIGARIGLEHLQLKRGRGYDHNWVLDGAAASMHRAAYVTSLASGRTLTVTTTEPGIQFYSGNFLDSTNRGRGGVVYAQRNGFCLETQHFPDSPNHPAFPSTALRPGQTLTSETVFEFGIEKPSAQK